MCFSDGQDYVSLEKFELNGVWCLLVRIGGVAEAGRRPCNIGMEKLYHIPHHNMDIAL